MLAPLNGTRYTRVSQIKRNAADSVDATGLEEDAVVQRTDTGCRIIVTPVELSATRNRVAVEDALQEIVLSMIVTYEVDQNGRLVDVYSSDVMEKLRCLVPEPIRSLMATMFSTEALLAKNKVEWDTHYTDPVGREMDGAALSTGSA